MYFSKKFFLLKNYHLVGRFWDSLAIFCLVTLPAAIFSA
jgi:hypothetical protein